MNLKTLSKHFPPSSLCFWVAFLTALYFPTLHLLYFAPYLAILLYKTNLIRVLWRAALSGILIDLLSSSPLFGVNALAYCLCIALLYTQRRHFFEDKLSTIPVIVFFFSLLTTSLQIILYPFFGITFPLSWRWFATDFLGCAFFDMAYALVIFILPFFLYKKVARMILYARLRKRHRKENS